MSATNRGAERKAYDFYATPIDVVLNFLGKQNISKLNQGGGGNSWTICRQWKYNKSIEYIL